MTKWRDVPGYEGLYQISIDTKEGKCRRFFKNGNIKELSNKPDNYHSRIFWSLCKDGKMNCHQAARWVAITYPELVENEYFDGAQIDHKDTDRLNNYPSNLRWVTPKGNSNNPITKEHMSEAMINNPYKSKKVYQYSKDGIIIAVYPSIQEAYRRTGIKQSNISNCCNGKLNQTGGYVWKFAS